jgi:hypothetical protein
VPEFVAGVYRGCAMSSSKFETGRGMASPVHESARPAHIARNIRAEECCFRSATRRRREQAQSKTACGPRKAICLREFGGVAHANSANEFDAATHHATRIRVTRRAICSRGEAKD